mmetsp:Transcript_18524/g.55889  ORF Transcript_18524/g.55889 Transcript_18524/m.55889 type:complete len:240 (+) Transcript_18524:2824-3543(+)
MPRYGSTKEQVMATCGRVRPTKSWSKGIARPREAILSGASPAFCSRSRMMRAPPAEGASATSSRRTRSGPSDTVAEAPPACAAASGQAPVPVRPRPETSGTRRMCRQSHTPTLAGRRSVPPARRLAPVSGATSASAFDWATAPLPTLAQSTCGPLAYEPRIVRSPRWKKPSAVRSMWPAGPRLTSGSASGSTKEKCGSLVGAVPPGTKRGLSSSSVPVSLRRPTESVADESMLSADCWR